MPKKPEIDPDEIDAFHHAMKGTKRLTSDKIRLTPPQLKRKKLEHQEKQTIELDETIELDHVSGEEFIIYHQAGIANKTLRKLRKGQYNVEAILDLHGTRVEEAKNAVKIFLQQSLDKGMRVVLIIHGKGHHSHMPILKNKLNQWLRKTNLVLAFCSAAATHGSRGAVYVLLKRMTGDMSE